MMPAVSPLTISALSDALIVELASAMGAVMGAEATASASAASTDAAWTVTVTIGGPAPGAVTVGMSQADCARLVRLVLGTDAEVGEAAIADLLRELVGQAVGSLRGQPSVQNVLLCVESPAPRAPTPDGTPGFFAIGLRPDFTPIVAVWTAADEVAAVASPAAATSSPLPGPSVQARRQDPPARQPAVPANLDVILDIDLPLSVRFGQTELTLDELTRLGPGSVIDLGRSPDDPVDVLVNGRLVARAEVVVVGGNYGVRILEVVSAADRVRTLTS